MTSTTDLSTTDLVAACEPTLIKTDVLGRMHRTREQRERILEEYERSGLSGPKFAALCGLKYQTLANWLQCRKRRRRDLKGKPQRQVIARVQWLEASMPPDADGAGTGLVLQLPGGVRARISNERQVKLAAALMRALEKPC